MRNTATAVLRLLTVTTMDEPTVLFDSYEHDFNQLINEVRQKLDGDDNAGGQFYIPFSLLRWLTGIGYWTRVYSRGKESHVKEG